MATHKPPKFVSENAEADWWASEEGRAFLKPQSPVTKQGGSSLVAKLGRASTVQIPLRLPSPGLAEAREIAEKKGGRISNVPEDAGP